MVPIGGRSFTVRVEGVVLSGGRGLLPGASAVVFADVSGLFIGDALLVGASCAAAEAVLHRVVSELEELRNTYE